MNETTRRVMHGFFLFPVGDPPKKCLEDDPSFYYEGS